MGIYDPVIVTEKCKRSFWLKDYELTKFFQKYLPSITKPFFKIWKVFTNQFILNT